MKRTFSTTEEALAKAMADKARLTKENRKSRTDKVVKMEPDESLFFLVNETVELIAEITENEQEKNGGITAFDMVVIKAAADVLSQIMEQLMRDSFDGKAEPLLGMCENVKEIVKEKCNTLVVRGDRSHEHTN